MFDPFQDVSAAPPGMIDMFVEILEKRAWNPEMAGIIEDYLDALDPEGRGAVVEVGCGTGAMLRRVAARFPDAQVIGIDAAAPLITAGAELAADVKNLSLGVADGADLNMGDGSAGTVLMHSLLTHVPDPAPLPAEAARILAPGGRLVVCDADFAKISLALCDHDPLDACA
jgi:arsenite methyltransferase